MMISYHTPLNDEAAKQVEWRQMYETMLQITDGLGKGIDPGILETVIVLNLLGIETSASCEGHNEYGTGAPWVDIEVLSVKDQHKNVAKMFSHALEEQKRGQLSSQEVKTLFAQAHQEKERVKTIHLVQRKKLLSYLSAFYVNHHVPYDRMIAIQARDTAGRARVESIGADFQNVAPIDIRARKLEEYQGEMQAFTAFLKEVYFSKLPLESDLLNI